MSTSTESQAIRPLLITPSSQKLHSMLQADVQKRTAIIYLIDATLRKGQKEDDKVAQQFAAAVEE
jgi:hypothetical protein